MLRQHIAKAAAFLLIGLGLLALAGPVLVPKNNDPEGGIHLPEARGILGEPEGSIDVIFAGDSESYTSYSPKLAEKKYGFTSYVCGSAGQKLFQTYGLLREALERQNPKAVVIETNCIFRTHGWFKDCQEIADYRLERLFPAVEYHDRWKILSPLDFGAKPSYTWINEQKGYHKKKGTMTYAGEKYMKKSRLRKSIRPMQKAYLDRIVDLCQEKGIAVVFYSVPSPKNWNYEKHNAIENYAKARGCIFWDLNLKTDKLKIDWKKDSYDGGDHLNHTGAKKITAYMGKKLKKKFHLAG